MSLCTCLPSFVSRSGHSIWGGVVWLSGCFPLRVFLHASPTLASGVRLSGSHHFLLICLPTHLSPNSCVFSLQSSVCGTVVVSDSVPCFSQSVSDFICLAMHLSPVVAVSCSCFIPISFVIGSYLCYFIPLCLLVVSGAIQHGPRDSNNMKIVPCDSCCPHLRCTKNCQHQELVSPQTCTQTLKWTWKLFGV